MKNCPFCNAEYEKDEDDFVYAADHDEWCPLRGTAYGGYGLTVGDTEDEIAAWNQRAERTCKIIEDPYRPIFRCCSECYSHVEGSQNYFPSCGAKVVGD